MMRRFEARESLRMKEAVAIGTGSRDPRDAKQTLTQWSHAAQGLTERAAKGTRRHLRQAGIGIREAPAKASTTAHG